MPEHRSGKHPFKPRARLLLLLGDQLIRDAGVAIFELVKNGYDADASNVAVTLRNPEDPPNASVVIADDGTGMDWETITDVWMEPGTDYRTKQFSQRERTTKFGRLPLGEKGVGRFAAHKLGRDITVISRRYRKPEVVVKIDWGQFEQARYIGDVKVEVTERAPSIFTGSQTGTRIEIHRLRDKWTRGMVRELCREVTSICSPFIVPESFRSELVLDPDPGWLEKLLKVDDVLELALFRAACEIEGARLTYDYRLSPPPAMDRVKGRSAKPRPMSLPEGCNLRNARI